MLSGLDVMRQKILYSLWSASTIAHLPRRIRLSVSFWMEKMPGNPIPIMDFIFLTIFIVCSTIIRLFAPRLIVTISPVLKIWIILRHYPHWQPVVGYMEHFPPGLVTGKKIAPGICSVPPNIVLIG